MDKSTIVNIASVVLVSAIAFYFIRKENKKSKSYFGGPASSTKDDQKTLEFYKSIYRPIKSDNRLPIFNRDKFELEDIAFTATQMVFNEPIPTIKEIESLKTGDLVKLLFKDKDEDVERMWVEIENIEGEYFNGVLRNDAVGSGLLTDGKKIFFHRNHIFDIDAG
jgi:hypothetical protein